MTLFKVENFGEKWVDFSLPFTCEVHSCFPRRQPSKANFSVLLHHTEPRALKWDLAEVKKYHTLFDLILSNEEELFDLPNVKKQLFGGLWVTDPPPEKKIMEASFLHSRGCGSPLLKGYKNRELLWEMKSKIKIQTNFFTSTKRPPNNIDINNNPYPFETKNNLFNSMYHFVIENSQERNYFTEKIVDAFYTYTVPIYLGCPNINDYFDPEGIIIANDIAEMIEYANTLSSHDYWSRMPAMAKNKKAAISFSDPIKAMRETILLWR